MPGLELNGVITTSLCDRVSVELRLWVGARISNLVLIILLVLVFMFDTSSLQHTVPAPSSSNSSFFRSVSVYFLLSPNTTVLLPFLSLP